MATNPQRPRWTYSEFARLPDTGSTRQEIIADQLVVTPAPSLHHQRIAGRLFARLFEFVERQELGEVFPAPLDVLFGEGDYMEPDIVFVRKERAGHVLTDRGVEGPPDLVVEILSPATEARDRGIKLDRYRLFGVGEYWIVDPGERAIEVWDLKDGATEPVHYAGDDRLRWVPAGASGPLTIPLPELFERR
ncbi:MAG: Uma2 family endonuclease [Gemmatimonadota bacterium]